MKPIKITVKPKLVPPPPPPAPPLPPALPPAPVAVTKFESEEEEEAPLPPPPPQMNAPVGPPPPEEKAPDDYEGYAQMAMRARSGRMDFAHFWTQMAQAEAQKEIADNLSELLEFLGARGADPEADDAPRLANELAAGILIAKEQIVSEVLGLVPAEIFSEFKVFMKNRMATALAEMKEMAKKQDA